MLTSIVAISHCQHHGPSIVTGSPAASLSSMSSVYPLKDSSRNIGALANMPALIPNAFLAICIWSNKSAAPGCISVNEPLVTNAPELPLTMFSEIFSIAIPVTPVWAIITVSSGSAFKAPFI